MYEPIVLIDKADPVSMGKAVERVWPVLSMSDRKQITTFVQRGLSKLLRQSFEESE